MSSVNSDDEQQQHEQPHRWVPTHVQVTVLRARGLRGKGKGGTSDVYTIIQVGKEKYSTCVVERSVAPEWKEECSFELLPGALEAGGRGAYPPGSCDLVLTVMHRALIGLDVFLGQAVVPLDKAFQDNVYAKNEAEWVNLRSRWFRLNSKTGKKEKERGEVQATVQFTRNNLTASMYHLAMKDKSLSAFSKLKERMRGKRRSSVDDDTAPGPATGAPPAAGLGAPPRSAARTRLPSDGGGEEEYEDDEGGEGRRNKMRTFFLRGKLRKSSETRSSTSLGSESSESSSRGGSLSPTAGISVVVSDLSNSPSNSSNLTADNSPEHTADISPKLSPDHSEFSDQCHEISIAVPALYRNGVHRPLQTPPLQPGPGGPVAPPPTAQSPAASPPPAEPQPPAALPPPAAKASPLARGLLLRPLPTSLSLQNLSPREEEPPRVPGAAGDGRRWSFDKPGEDDKAAIAAALEKSGPMVGDEEEEEEALSEALSEAPSAATGAARESYDRKKKKKMEDGSDAAPERTGKGWFGLKDSNNKPSPVVPPKLGPIPESPYPPPPPLVPPSRHPPWGPSAPPAPPSPPTVSPLHHTNPFFQSQGDPPLLPPMSPGNPFLSTTLQHHPPAWPQPPPLPPLSSARPPVAHLFSQEASSATGGRPALPHEGEASAQPKKRPLPPPPPAGAEERPPSRRSPNPFACGGTGEPDWDDSFEAFASCRLQAGPQQRPEPRRGPARNLPEGPLLEFWDIDTEEPPQNTEPVRDPDPQCGDTLPEASSDWFAQLLAALPATNQEASMLPTSALDPPGSPGGCADTNYTTLTANSSSDTDLTSTTPPPALCIHCRRTHCPSTPCEVETLRDSSVSTNPSSSGVGSLAEEDVLSGTSSGSASEKSSSGLGDDAEARSISGYTLSPSERSPNQTAVGLQRNSEEKPVDRSCSLIMGRKVEGGSPEVSDPNDKPQSVILMEEPQWLVPLSATSLAEMQHGAGPSEEQRPARASLFDLSPNNLNPSIPSDLGFEPTVSKTQKTEGGFGLQESFGNLQEPEYLSFQAAKDDEESVIPDVLDTKGTPPCPSFHTVTSSFLGDESSLLEAPFATGCLDDQLVHHRSPKTPGLLCVASSPTKTFTPILVFNESSLSSLESPLDVHSSGELLHINTGQTLSAPVQVLDSPAAQRELAESQPGEGGCPSSLDGSADSQHYQTCLTHNSSAPTAVSAGSPAERSSDDARSSASTLCPALQRSNSTGALACGRPKRPLTSYRSDPSVVQSLRLPPDPGPAPDPARSPLLSLPPPSCLPTAPLARRALPSANVYALPPPGPTPSAPPPAPRIAPAPAPAPEEAHAAVRLVEVERREKVELQQNSPHPVRPLTPGPQGPESRSVLASGLEKLRSTIQPGRSSPPGEAGTERRKSLTEGAGSYYHLTHNELVALLVRREADQARQRAEFERQTALLSRREVELKRLKPQVRDLENYIDTLLVRIMEQTPTLLQVRSKFK